ncbi:MAG: hypothetical protein JWO06_3590 [Bacteroidota bacterium]|nr:hypothetical protein [Bacteroidota bacterium]
MKKLFAPFVLLAFFFTASAQSDSAEITFAKTSHDFGTLKKNGPTTVKFEFQNTGKAPLVISEVQRTCGCTTPHFPDQAINPGAKNFVEVHFDSTRIGAFTKTVYVHSNAKNNNVPLTIKGTILDEPVKPAEIKKD